MQKEISTQKITNVVLQMDHLKAPGPDDIPAVFYQKHWGVVGPDISAAVHHFFDQGYLIRE